MLRLPKTRPRETLRRLRSTSDAKAKARTPSPFGSLGADSASSFPHCVQPGRLSLANNSMPAPGPNRRSSRSKPCRSGLRLLLAPLVKKTGARFDQQPSALSALHRSSPRRSSSYSSRCRRQASVLASGFTRLTNRFCIQTPKRASRRAPVAAAGRTPTAPSRHRVRRYPRLEDGKSYRRSACRNSNVGSSLDLLRCGSRSAQAGSATISSNGPDGSGGVAARR